MSENVNEEKPGTVQALDIQVETQPDPPDHVNAADIEKFEIEDGE